MGDAGEFATMLAAHVDHKVKLSNDIKPDLSRKSTPSMKSWKEGHCAWSGEHGNHLHNLPPLLARDLRIVRYRELKLRHQSPLAVAASKKLVLEMQQHDWLQRHSLIPIPRTALGAVQKAALKEAFDLMDRSGDGEIDHDELKVTMKSLGFSDKDIRDAIAEGDHDGNGSLDFEEFCTMISEQQRKKSRDHDETFPFSLVVSSQQITNTVDDLYEAAVSFRVPLVLYPSCLTLTARTRG